MTHINKFLSVVGVAILTLVISCSDEDDQGPQGSDSAMVYLAGNDYGEPSSPGYWSDNVFTGLDAPMGGDANSIHVSGSNVYVGGRIWSNNAQTQYKPCYWFNDVLKELPLPNDRPMCNGLVTSIDVAGGAVYAAGFYDDSIGFTINKWMRLPGIWKSAEAEVTKLAPLYKNAIGEEWWGRANAVDVVDVGAYCVAGYSSGEDGYSNPCYWAVGLPDGAQINPDDEIEPGELSTKGYGGSAEAVDVHAQGNLSQPQLLFAGYVVDADGVNVPCYWSGGTRTDLSRINDNDHGVAKAIAYDGVNIHIAGYTSNNSGSFVPCVWSAPGGRTDLPLPNGSIGGEAHSVVLNNGDVYVGGSVSLNGSNYPCYWKNGEIVQISAQGVARAMSLGD